MRTANNRKYVEIANEAGVSPASVTRFFDSRYSVRKDTEEKIVGAIKRLKANIPFENFIGLIIPDADNPYFTSIAFEFEDEMEKKGWHLLISSSERKLDREMDLIERYKVLGIKGLIYIHSGSQSEELLASLIADSYDLPVLSFDREIVGRKFDYVATDCRKGTLQAVDYLVTRGHKRIAYLKGLEGTSSAYFRFKSFEDAMDKNKLVVDHEHLVFDGDYQLAAGVQCADRLIELSEEMRPSAIICANDLMAIGLMQHVQRAGWKLPQDLSVIGFDNIKMSQWVYPTLTTIAQPIKTLVHIATEMVLKRIENKDIEQQSAEVAPALIPRESVGDFPSNHSLKLFSLNSMHQVTKTEPNHHE